MHVSVKITKTHSYTCVDIENNETQKNKTSGFMVKIYLVSSPTPAFERLSVSVTPTVDLTNFETKAHPSCEMIDLIRNQIC